MITTLVLLLIGSLALLLWAVEHIDRYGERVGFGYTLLFVFAVTLPLWFVQIVMVMLP